MARFLINLDVPDIDRGIAFYAAAFGLRVGRRFDADFVEMLGGEAPLYLLRKEEGSDIGPAGGGRRRYSRHWTPAHLDIVVQDLEAGIEAALKAGAVREGEICDAAYGRLAMFADPFGHGFCLIEFNEIGYDALL